MKRNQIMDEDDFKLLGSLYIQFETSGSVRTDCMR